MTKQHEIMAYMEKKKKKKRKVIFLNTLRFVICLYLYSKLVETKYILLFFCIFSSFYSVRLLETESAKL